MILIPLMNPEKKAMEAPEPLKEVWSWRRRVRDEDSENLKLPPTERAALANKKAVEIRKKFTLNLPRLDKQD